MQGEKSKKKKKRKRKKEKEKEKEKKTILKDDNTLFKKSILHKMWPKHLYTKIKFVTNQYLKLLNISKIK